MYYTIPQVWKYTCWINPPKWFPGSKGICMHNDDKCCQTVLLIGWYTHASTAGVWGVSPILCPEIPRKSEQTRALRLHRGHAARASVCFTSLHIAGGTLFALGCLVRGQLWVCQPPRRRRSSLRSHPWGLCSRVKWWAWSERSSEDAEC